jgi:hypothetical protein
MAEKGILPEDDFRLINKLENFLGIKIVKTPAIENTEITMTIQDNDSESLSFDPVTTKVLTISDLKEMKQRKESEIFEKPEKDFEEIEELEKISEEEIEEVPLQKFLEDKEDLTESEMDDLIFGRK